MPSHTYHDRLPGYDPAQIYADGCGECEERADSYDLGIRYLTPEQFAVAWERAATLHNSGLGNASDAEHKLLRTLAAVRIQLAAAVGLGLIE
jgi:hypothetical protein